MSIRKAERGVALLTVAVVMVVALVLGLAAVAITSGELSSSRGFRTRAATDACVEAAVEKIRNLLPSAEVTAFGDIASSTWFDGSQGSWVTPSGTMKHGPGHYSGPADEAFIELDATDVDLSALFMGENITNVMGTVRGGSLAEGYHVLSAVAVCEGAGSGKREMQLVVRYGTPTGAR